MPDLSKRLLFLAPRALSIPQAAFFVATAEALLNAGHQALCVTYDIASDGDTIPITNLLRKTKLEEVPLFNWLQAGDTDAASEWLNQLEPHAYPDAIYLGTATLPSAHRLWEIGIWVKSDVHRQIYDEVLDLGDRDVANVYAAFMHRGICAALAYTRLCTDVSPTTQVLINGTECVSRIALELGKRHGLVSYCQESGANAERTVIVRDGHWLDLAAFEHLWGDWCEVPLATEEVNELAQLLMRRCQSSKEQRESMEMRHLHTGRLWVLYTSIFYRSTEAPDHGTAFATQEDWIEATVSYVRDRPEIFLVVRVHPQTRSCRHLRYYENLRGRLPENAQIILPTEPTDVYALAWRAELTLAWHSTIGLEAMIMGRPVIRVGTGWLSRCGFIPMAEGETDYLARLEGARINPPKVSIEALVAAWRFGYAWFYRQSFALPPRVPDAKIAAAHCHFALAMSQDLPLDCKPHGNQMSAEAEKNEICRHVANLGALVMR